MDLKQIKELMAAMEKSGVKKVSLKEKTGFELQIECKDEFPQQIVHQTAHHHPSFIPHPMSRPHEVAHAPLQVTQTEQQPALSKNVEGKYVTSPMVGTLYLSASPEHSPFVKVGDKVEEGSVVCIVEAMKVMNEVKAGVSGVLAEVCLENGHPVEFGTKLFRIV